MIFSPEHQRCIHDILMYISYLVAQVTSPKSMLVTYEYNICRLSWGDLTAVGVKGGDDRPTGTWQQLAEQLACRVGTVIHL